MGKNIDDSYKLLIGGKWVDGKSKNTYDLLCPANDEKLTTCAVADKEDVDEAVNAALTAFETWKDTSVADRAKALFKIADLIEENLDRLAMIESMDAGIPITGTQGLIQYGADTCRYYASAIQTDDGGAVFVDKNTLNLIIREPVGVVGEIVPWNCPFALALWKIAPALACGDTVVCKPSSEAPLSILELGKIISKVVPPGVFNVINGRGSTSGQYLLDNSSISKLSFTGSTEVGYMIADAAAKKLIPATLELGGKSANIFFPDCHWEKAVEGAAVAMLTQAGQLCHAGSRAFVHKDIYNKFIKDVSALYNRVKVGIPWEKETQMGPLITKTQLNKVLSYIELGQKEGARLVCGGKKIAGKGLDKGYFIEPTIFSEVNNSMRIAREEIFGPVLTVIPFSEEAEVLKMANDTEYGLAGGVWTSDLNRAIRVSRNIRTGRMWVNTWGEVPLQSPFGGYKKSGVGRENHHKYTMDHYSQVKTILINLNDGPSGAYPV